MKTKTLALFLALIFICSCSSTNIYKIGFTDKAEILKKINRADYPTQKDYPDADGVVLYESNVHSTYTKNSVNSYEQVNKVIKVFKNFSKLATIIIPMDYFDELVAIKGRVIQPDSTVKLLTGEDFFTTTFKGNDKDAFEKLITLKFPNLVENSIIEFSFIRKTKLPIFGETWYIQDFDVPKLYAEYKITSPTSITFMFLIGKKSSYFIAGTIEMYLSYIWKLNLNNISGYKEPQTAKDGDFVSNSWSFYDIPAFIPESKMPPFSYHRAKIEFSLAEDRGWSGISKYYQKEFYQPVFKFADSLKILSDSLTKNCITKLDKIISLKNYVQSIRYEAIGLGKGGYMPRSPLKVVEKGYGDCKDKSLLLISLLNCAGINAKPVLLKTADEGYVDVTFPIFQFNHMIVLVYGENNEEYWIDPTAELCPLKEIPWRDEGLNVFVLLNDYKYEFKQTPLSAFTQNKNIVNIKVKITSDSSAHFQVNINLQGQYDLMYRNWFNTLSIEDRTKKVKELFSADFMDSKLDSLNFSDCKDLNTPFNISFEFTSENIFNKQGNILLLNYDPFQKEMDLSWLSKKERIYPIFNDFLETKEINIEIEYPDSLIVLNALPENTILLDDNYDFKKIYTTSQSKIMYHKSFIVRNIMIKKEKYEDVKNFFSKASKSNKNRIIFTRKLV